MPKHAHIGAFIQRLRINRGLDPAVTGRAIGITRQGWNCIEQGRSPRAETLDRVCTAFNSLITDTVVTPERLRNQDRSLLLVRGKVKVVKEAM